MLQLAQVSKAYGERDIIHEVSLSVSPGERVALVGRNGCGKTTLLRMIAGLMPVDRGAIALAPSCRIGYLGQEGQLNPDRTLDAEMKDVFADVWVWEARLRELEAQMEGLTGRELEVVLEEYGELQARYDHAEVHTIDARIRTICAGLGFVPADLERMCSEFSGGWQMRGAMARVLLWAPDLLLLDEPTNHLDVSAVEWLEDFLNSYRGAVIIVSHDRTFLDRAVTRTVELSGGELEEYAGNYTYYLEESDRRFELQLALYKSQQRKLAQDMRFIERFRYKATLSTRVKSREKMLEKRDLVDMPDLEERAIKVSFLPAESSGREALVAKGLNKSYGPRKVLENVSVKLERGQKVALVGRNGAGKSTLLRMLAGQEQPDAGRIQLGLRLTPVYFAQHQAETLTLSRTILEELRVVAPGGTETELRTLLGCLLFKADEVFKPISVLSGGERSRVALARCIVTPSNLMMLDEPTNHLDIAARESLLAALQDYPGSLLMITHDRYFMDQLATDIWEVSDHGVHVYPGSYQDYRRAKDKEARQAESLAAAVTVKKAAPSKRPVASGGSAPKKTLWKLEALEAKIFALEDELSALTARLSDPELYKDAAAAARTQADYEARKAQCEELTEIWDEMTTAKAP